MKMAVIGERETVAGFALGGVSMRFPVDDLEGAEAALSSVIEEGDVAILLVTPRFASLLEKDIENLRMRKAVYPIVVVLPSKKGEPQGPDRIGALIRRAVGIALDEEEQGGEAR